MNSLLILIITFVTAGSYMKVHGSSAEQLLCADGLKSISPSSLCNYVSDCADGSDELNFNLCRILSAQKRRCVNNINEVQCKTQYGQFNYLNQACMDIITACSLGKKCLSDADLSLCSEISDNKLKPPFMPPEIKKAEEFRHMLKYIEKSLNEAVKKNFRICPTFFIPLNEKKCVSLFTPAQIPWSEAGMFCESIGGELAVIDNLELYTQVLKIIHKRDINSEFWIGGFSGPGETELEENVTEIHRGNSTETQKWTWLNGDSVVMGAPFWSLYTEEINRKNNACGDLVQRLMPRHSNLHNKTCLAILQKNHFYFSDELCSERFAPLCVASKLT